jgi:hypothetical protein
MELEDEVTEYFVLVILSTINYIRWNLWKYTYERKKIFSITFVIISPLITPRSPVIGQCP